MVTVLARDGPPLLTPKYAPVQTLNKHSKLVSLRPKWRCSGLEMYEKGKGEKKMRSNEEEIEGRGEERGKDLLPDL